MMEGTYFIPVMQPRLPQAEALLPYLERIDAARIYSNFGPLYGELAHKLAGHFGVSDEQVALFANGTLALQAAIETVGDAGDTWVVPSWTFVATGQAVMSARRRIHFADVDGSTWALSPRERPFARGQVIVAPFGDRPRLREWQDIRCFRVFDAASCFDACSDIGADLDDRSIVMISLHATKPLPAGEGAVLVGAGDWVQQAAKWGNFGFSGSRVAAGPGMNAKLSEYHAAVGLASMAAWGATREELAQRAASAARLSIELGLMPQPSMLSKHVTTTWNVRFPEGIDESIVLGNLNRLGIDHRRWWPCGVDEMPAFGGMTKDDLDITRQLTAEVLGLPFGSHVDDEALDRIAEAITLGLASA